MKKRHLLRLIGITYNQIESGVYALILEEVEAPSRRIPIVIGFPEAQAIECKLQEVRTPRPLTHDLMKNIMERFDLNLVCVDIHKLSTGVFAGELVMENGNGDLQKIDARSSDAIALAIRTGAPIYTSAEVLDECGLLPSGKSASPAKSSRNLRDVDVDAVADEIDEFLRRSIDASSSASQSHSGLQIESFDNLEQLIVSEDVDADFADADIMQFLANYTDREIERQIAKFASEEKYEIAARLKALLSRRKGE